MPFRLGAVALACAAAVTGCKGRTAGQTPSIDAAPPPAPEVIFVENIAVSVPLWLDAAGPEPEPRTVAARLWETLAQSPDFVTAGRRAPVDAAPGTALRGARLKADIGLEKADAAADKPARLRAAVALSMSWIVEDEEIAPWATSECDGEVPPAAQLPAAAASLVECALADAARSLVEKQGVRRGDVPGVLRALDSPDPSLRQVAFAAVADRQLRGAVPRLLELLASKDELIRDGAIGALVALREPRAIKPLTELAQFRDLDMMRRVIDAIGAIGGDDARAYLEMVASGHDVPAVRELAQGALDRLNRRSRAPDAGE